MSSSTRSLSRTAASPLYLGVDGGGTHCRARLYDAHGRSLGEGHAGSASLRHGVPQVWQEILHACHDALATAGLDEAALPRIRAGLGLAGAVDAATRRRVAEHSHPFAAVTVASDAETAVLGAFDGGDGGVLIIGTGSCGMGRVAGRFHSIGGWGFPLSDHASGAWIGLRALRAALLCREGLHPSSPLAERLLSAFDNDVLAMVQWQYSAQPRDYARFAAEVFHAAESGDALALALRQQAVEEATLLADGVLGLGVTRLCLLGSVGQALAPLLPARLQPYLSVPRGDAMDGARRLAHTSGGPSP